MDKPIRLYSLQISIMSEKLKQPLFTSPLQLLPLVQLLRGILYARFIYMLFLFCFYVIYMLFMHCLFIIFLLKSFKLTEMIDNKYLYIENTLFSTEQSLYYLTPLMKP